MKKAETEIKNHLFNIKTYFIQIHELIVATTSLLPRHRPLYLYSQHVYLPVSQYNTTYPNCKYMPIKINLIEGDVGCMHVECSVV